MIKTVVKAFPCFSKKKKNVKKHKKNVILFIVDIISHCCTVEPLQMLFLEKLSMTNSWVQQFSGFLLLFQYIIWFVSLKYLQIIWNPVKPDVLQYWENRIWLIIGWKPYLKKLHMTDFWLDLGLTQTCQVYKINVFQRNQLTDYMT